MGDSGLFGKEVTCVVHHWIIKCKFCLEWAVQREAPQNMAPFSILRDPQLHSHWPSYSHWSRFTVKPGDKQTNKSSAHCGSLTPQSHKVTDGQNRKEWIIPQPKIISLRRPWRQKTEEKKENQNEELQVAWIKTDAKECLSASENLRFGFHLVHQLSCETTYKWLMRFFITSEH